MKIIDVNTAKPYKVYIEPNLLSKIDAYIKQYAQCRIMIITDDIVDVLYGNFVYQKLIENKLNVNKFVIPHGENSKNKDILFKILEELSRLKFDRNDLLLALGGGVVGDITGFAAGVYMRGIRYIQVPTTLLSAIDSSVGGKTAINLGAVKNQVGVFNQPEAVLIDTETIKECPRKIFVDGMGEGVKYALLCGGRLSDLVKDNAVMENLEEFVSLCIQYKAKIVSQDEKENGLRRLLNLGHTVGHAIEALSRHLISHGTAVVYGIEMLCGALALDGVINTSIYYKIKILIAVYFDLPLLNYNARDIVEVIKNDKKADGCCVKIVYPQDIGDMIQRDITFEDLETILDKFITNQKKELVNDCKNS